MKASADDPFVTFWQGGYEGADHINRAQKALSMNQSTGHSGNAFDDYVLLQKFGIRTVRESIGWRLTEINNEFDFSSVEPRARAAQQLGLQICWTFCHYGWPEDIDVYSAEFITRFARFCRAAAEFLAPFSDRPPIYSPLNEISFTSWGLSVHLFHCKNMFDERAHTEAKRQLVRATLAGCDAIWQVSPDARFMHCDPVIHVVAPPEHPEWQQWATDWNSAQYDSWDMLCGRREPELGGHPRYLDIIGANYYHDNQWECGTYNKLWWHLADSRRRPLHDILAELHQRYQRPILLAETSHVGSGRGIWIKQVAAEMALALQKGVTCLGVCLYPLIDRHDWENDSYWHHSGLWDIANAPQNMQRTLPFSYAAGLRQAQRFIENFQMNTSIHIRSGVYMPTIIVFCHLRWDFVYQRPQHLLSQLAQHFEIIVVEEPFYHAGKSFLKTYTPAPNITVCQPHTPVHATGFHDDQLAELEPLIATLVRDGENPIVWFYTPMALPLLKQLHAKMVVYDCMDELSAFQNAPKQLLQREKALLNSADIVFTGGPSLYQAKRNLHPNVHCFPSSVDAVHFEQALDRSNSHPLQAALHGPKLGFYGVIDERLDLNLIAALADAHSDWHIIIVGPVVKINPDTLPRRANIHYFGQQPYQALPQFLAEWDLCLLPFALNESTRFISPTKVLEYMAAQLPVVSTAIEDVVTPYGDIVAIGYDIPHFIAACETALAASESQTKRMAEKMRALVATTSWERTGNSMFQLIRALAQKGKTSRSQCEESASANSANVAHRALNINSLRPQQAMQSVSCAIIGAGPTGLSAAYHLGEDTLLLERNATVGGWCRSIKDSGFTFDYAGHIMFSNDPYVLELYDILLGDNQHWQNREAWVYSKTIHTRYPFQGALFGLPPEIIKECIVGAIDARYKPASCNEPAVSQNPNSASGLTSRTEDCCADGTSVSAKQSSVSSINSPPNFEDFIYGVWGAGIAKHFAIPYNKKLWTIPLTEMETSWLGGRVPLPDLAEIIDGALQPVAKSMGPNARFGYPKKGGFQALVSGFVPHIKGQIELNTDVVQLLPVEHLMVLADGRRFRYDNLISTMPLPELVRLMGNEAPKEVQDAAQGLRHISVRCVNIGINREKVTDKHWIYYPEDTIFHRIFLQGNASPECNAPGGFGFTCEISYSPWKPLPVDGDELIARCIEDCIKVGLMTSEDQVITANLVDMPYAYVIYDHSRAENVALVKVWMETQDITLAGRYSEWEYYNSDHAFLAGKKAAEKVGRQIKSQNRVSEGDA
ncbi:protoporphyrinogen oxidase [Rheinheimera sp. A13L]|uniref:NAD(P)-binding protein n=1 Tax=Rheinheimera sp. A13L TaxID=506534 RepID=UPI0002125698|nr:NAD(P)-binding protein [Rheinheimera sp. A13L]EGM77359.1 protoporphyrinogen oxidase [Rheinheimera sp. A13L]